MPEKAKNINPHLHNNFLQILIERGVITLISLILAFISIFINLIKKIKNSLNLEKVVSIAGLFVFISFMVAGFFEYNFGDSEIKFFIFYFLSIPFLTLNYKEKFVNDIIEEKVKNND
jgi:O-antigen ligase